MSAVLGSFAYRYSPVWAQESLLAARASLRGLLREGRAFKALGAKVDESQWWSVREWRNYQAHKLRAVVCSAAREVPYYRDKYAALGLDPGRAAFPEVMAALPLIGKEQVRACAAAFRSSKSRGPVFTGSTSGTTGAPLKLDQDLAAINRENAFLWRQLTWAGFRLGARRAWMRGDMIVPAAQSEPPYWRTNRAENMLMLSSYHLAAAAAPAYLSALVRFDPVVIQAYPSSIGFLSGWMRSEGVRYRGTSLRGIVTSSETLSDASRREIESAFGCKVFDWYGQFERVAAIGTCEQGRHHILADYSFVELLPAGAGLYELVGTGFNNLSMPLIRYRSGDLVRPAPSGERCPCGRSFPLVQQIVGRDDDPVKLGNGRSIGRLDHIFKDVDGVLEAQIRQDQLDAVTILVVPAATFNERTRSALFHNARQRLGRDVAVRLETVAAIPRTANGKFKGVVCTI